MGNDAPAIPCNARCTPRKHAPSRDHAGGVRGDCPISYDAPTPLTGQIREARAARHVAPLLAGQIPPDYIEPVPIIDLPADELAAVTAAIRGVIDGDRYPHAPRLDPLRAALARFEAAQEPTPTAASQSRRARAAITMAG